MINFLAGVWFSFLILFIGEINNEYKMECKQVGMLDVCEVTHQDGFKTKFARMVEK